MDLQVQELLDRIKTEGVDAAKAEAARILKDAEDRAAGIAAAAEKAAADAERASQARIAGMEAASRAALTQASRDALIGLKARVHSFMEQALRSDAAKAFGPDAMGALLPRLLVAAAEGSHEASLEVLLDAKTLSALDASLAARLSAEIGKGVVFKPFAGIDAGFRISTSDGAVQYDYSAESAAAIIASRVNARLADCVRDAAKGN